MHYDNEKEVFKQVRAKRGGGTRKLSVSKDAHKKQLIQEAVHLFFPNGRNSLGSLTDFELGLTNYQEVPLDEVTTVGKLYQETKRPLLRFYLTTQTKEHNNRAPSPDSAPSVEGQERAQSSTTLVSVSTSQPSDTFETVSPEVLFVGSNVSAEGLQFAVYETDGNIEDVLESSDIVFV